MSKIRKWDEVNGVDDSAQRLAAFLERSNDSYAILQLKREDELSDRRFLSYRYLREKGEQPSIDHYEVVYHGPLEHAAGTAEQLEGLYLRFNLDHPEDFRGHSLSVSDIVALRVDGVVSCHYVDSIGFVELPGFLKPENYLKIAEMLLEDDYGMLDGIVNNAKHPALEERPSVLEQLRERQGQDTPRKPSRRPPERAME